MTQEQIEQLVKTLLTAPVLLGVVGGIISLLTSYLYGFREWYAKLDPVQKAGGQFGLITLVVLLIALVSFTGLIAVVPANTVGGLVLAMSWLAAVWTNQSTYQATKNAQPASVVVIKAEQKKAELSDAKAEVKEAAAVADTEPEKKVS